MKTPSLGIFDATADRGERFVLLSLALPPFHNVFETLVGAKMRKLLAGEQVEAIDVALAQ